MEHDIQQTESWIKECFHLLQKNVDELRYDIKDLTHRLKSIEEDIGFFRKIFSRWKGIAILLMVVAFLDHKQIIEFINSAWGWVSNVRIF